MKNGQVRLGLPIFAFSGKTSINICIHKLEMKPRSSQGPE
jgi:hypothetical protein